MAMGSTNRNEYGGKGGWCLELPPLPFVYKSVSLSLLEPYGLVIDLSGDWFT
jgi:hypothetical protein